VNSDLSSELAEQVRQAYTDKNPLVIRGGGSKAFYGNDVKGSILDVSSHRGIIEYQPSELVITARSGTPLKDIEAELAANGQMLAFEPPVHTADATFGGAIACGLSGPRRASSGAARDFVLGTRIINGKGEQLRFGGQVMKNVAGYDASRLMTGAQGTLGVLLDISVKVLPMPARELTLSLAYDETEALTHLNDWIRQGLPVSASCLFGNSLIVRLGNTVSSVDAAASLIGGAEVDGEFWDHIRNQTHDFYKQADLWRVSVPPATPPLANGRPQMIEWAGALRWIVSDEPLYDLAKQHGGHATRYSLGGDSIDDCFQPLDPAMLALHRRIKLAFDPQQILNPGRMYKAL